MLLVTGTLILSARRLLLLAVVKPTLEYSSGVGEAKRQRQVWYRPYNVCMSESLLCHSTAVEVCLCLVLYCVGDLNPLPAELPW